MMQKGLCGLFGSWMREYDKVSWSARVLHGILFGKSRRF